MRALVKEAGHVRLVDVPELRVRRADDVIVRVLVAGLCRTDLYVADGRIASAEPITLGHELCGRVTASGDARVAVGALVAIDPRIDGGFLGVTHHGAFADYVCVPAANVLALPEIDPRRGAYVEPIAAALAVPSIVPAGTHVGVIGTNRFAELLAAVLQSEGCVVERDGAFDTAVETTGDAFEIAALCEALRPGGTLILKSRTPDPVALPLGKIVDKQLVVRGVRYGSFTRAVELVSSLELDPLFGESWPLAGWETAFARARVGEATKLFLRMDDDPCAA